MHTHLLQLVNLAEAVQAGQQQCVQVPAVKQVGVLVEGSSQQLMHVSHHLLLSHRGEIQPLTAHSNGSNSNSSRSSVSTNGWYSGSTTGAALPVPRA